MCQQPKGANMIKFNLNRVDALNGMKVATHTNLGGYPLFYITKDCCVLSPETVNSRLELCSDTTEDEWFVVGYEINYEDEGLYCEHSGELIPCAYPST